MLHREPLTAQSPNEGGAVVLAVLAETTLRAINEIEIRIATADTSIDVMRWRQAEHVLELLNGGMSQRRLAKLWINPRTDKPYTIGHVQVTRRVYSDYSTSHPRPVFSEEYNRLANRGRFSCCTGDNEWNTPANIIESARSVLGTIGLDPASNEAANVVVRATRFFSLQDDGLKHDWGGKIWLNPPFSRDLINLFVAKLVRHVQDGSVTEAIVLTSNTTDTQWFATLSGVAVAVCLPTGRVRFWKGTGVAAQSSLGTAIFCVGPDPEAFRRAFRRFGSVWICPSVGEAVAHLGSAA